MLRIGGDTEGTWKGSVDGAGSREGRREREPGHMGRGQRLTLGGKEEVVVDAGGFTGGGSGDEETGPVL